MVISAAVEGLVDETVVGRLVVAAGADLGRVYGKNGKQNLLQRLNGFNEAARRFPWLVLIDLDADFTCAPLAVNAWLPTPSTWMCFRVARPETEAWLLADRDMFARYFRVRPARVPHSPEDLADAKQALVDLARHSTRRDIREDVVPRSASGRQVGPGYTGRIIDYAATHRRPEVAANSAPTLEKALRALGDLANRCRRDPSR